MDLRSNPLEVRHVGAGGQGTAKYVGRGPTGLPVRLAVQLCQRKEEWHWRGHSVSTPAASGAASCERAVTRRLRGECPVMCLQLAA